MGTDVGVRQNAIATDDSVVGAHHQTLSYGRHQSLHAENAISV